MCKLKTNTIIHTYNKHEKGNLRMKQCFIVTPIGSEESEVRKRADQVFKYIIEPVCSECGFDAIRVDHINNVDSITQTIIDMLGKSELVIADMTDHNPNVFYEMGFRVCTGKPMINLKQKGESIPFDISSIRAFDYDLSDLDSVDEVKKRLEQTILSLNIAERVLDSSKEKDNIDGKENIESLIKVLPILYDIQDQITKLRDDIKKKDTETIQAIVKASQPPALVEDSTTAVLKVLLPELIKNPNAFKTLLEFGDMESNSEKNNQ